MSTVFESGWTKEMSKCENNWSGNVTTIVLVLAYEYTINNSFGKSSKNMLKVRIGGF